MLTRETWCRATRARLLVRVEGFLSGLLSLEIFVSRPPVLSCILELFALDLGLLALVLGLLSHVLGLFQDEPSFLGEFIDIRS